MNHIIEIVSNMSQKPRARHKRPEARSKQQETR
jgi:hypothetical protein